MGLTLMSLMTKENIIFLKWEADVNTIDKQKWETGSERFLVLQIISGQIMKFGLLIYSDSLVTIIFLLLAIKIHAFLDWYASPQSMWMYQLYL